MGTRTDYGSGHTAQATIRSVVVTGLGTYRRSFGAIVAIAILVFAPIDLVVTLATMTVTAFAEGSDILSVFMWTSGTALGIAAAMLSMVFFAGLVDRVVAVDQQGEKLQDIGRALRELPTWRLLLASVLTGGLVIAGLMLLLVPGFILMVLLAVVGPVIVAEGLGAWQGIKRSAALTWRHAWLVFVTVLLPTALDEELSSWLEHFRWHERPWLAVPVDVASTIVVGGLVGVFEVTLAHALIADHRRRLRQAEEARAGADGVPAHAADR